MSVRSQLPLTPAPGHLVLSLASEATCMQGDHPHRHDLNESLNDPFILKEKSEARNPVVPSSALQPGLRDCKLLQGQPETWILMRKFSAAKCWLKFVKTQHGPNKTLALSSQDQKKTTRVQLYFKFPSMTVHSSWGEWWENSSPDNPGLWATSHWFDHKIIFRCKRYSLAWGTKCMPVVLLLLLLFHVTMNSQEARAIICILLGAYFKDSQ